MAPGSPALSSHHRPSSWSSEHSDWIPHITASHSYFFSLLCSLDLSVTGSFLWFRLSCHLLRGAFFFCPPGLKEPYSPAVACHLFRLSMSHLLCSFYSPLVFLSNEWLELVRLLTTASLAFITMPATQQGLNQCLLADMCLDKMCVARQESNNPERFFYLSCPCCLYKTANFLENRDFIRS